MYGLTNALLSMQTRLPHTGSVNYGPEQPWPVCGNRLIDMPIGSVECVLVLDSEGELVAGLALDLPRESSARNFLCTVVTSVPIEDLRRNDPFEKVRAVSTVEYAYARSLPADISPISETRMKRSWLGAVRTAVPPRGSDWICKSADVVDGAIKGLYPVNYWNGQVRNRIELLGIILPTDLPRKGLAIMSPSQLKDVQVANPDFGRYVYY